MRGEVVVLQCSLETKRSRLLTSKDVRNDFVGDNDSQCSFMHVVDAALKARDQEWRLLRQMSTLMMGHDFLSSLCDNSVKDSLKILV